MTRDIIKKTVIASVLDIAPEADFDLVDAQEDLREQLDIDSMDFLNLLTALHKALGVEIPESDYSKVGTLDALIAYLEAHAKG